MLIYIMMIYTIIAKNTPEQDVQITELQLDFINIINMIDSKKLADYDMLLKLIESFNKYMKNSELLSENMISYSIKEYIAMLDIQFNYRKNKNIKIDEHKTKEIKTVKYSTKDHVLFITIVDYKNNKIKNIIYNKPHSEFDKNKFIASSIINIGDNIYDIIYFKNSIISDDHFYKFIKQFDEFILNCKLLSKETIIAEINAYFTIIVNQILIKNKNIKENKVYNKQLDQTTRIYSTNNHMLYKVIDTKKFSVYMIYNIDIANITAPRIIIYTKNNISYLDCQRCFYKIIYVNQSLWNDSIDVMNSQNIPANKIIDR